MTAAQPGAYRDIAEIKLKYPLLDVVERAGVRLRRAGARRWQGLCPFHEDHNPSFFVDVEDQRFVCFGCKSRGDVLDFVRMHEHLNTVGEACAWLTGTPVPPGAAARRSVYFDSTTGPPLGPTDARRAACAEHRWRFVSGRAVAEPASSRLPYGARSSRLGGPRLRAGLFGRPLAGSASAQARRVAYRRGPGAVAKARKR